MNKKVLILGSKGMLGTDLMEVFRKYNSKGWDKEELDITNKEQVRKKIFELKPEIVINAAAYTDVDKCEKEKELANKVNGLAVKYIAEACQKNNIILVHYSTDYVFRGNKKRGKKRKFSKSFRRWMVNIIRINKSNLS